MATKSDMILLYSIIESRLKDNPPASLIDLKKHCEKEFKDITKKQLVISEETLLNDIDNLKSILEIPIKKSKLSGGYYLAKKEITFLSKVDSKGESYKLKFRYLFGEITNDSVYNHVGVKLQTKGWQHLLPISKAIKERFFIHFKYRISSGKFQEIELLPIELICLNFLWYIIGVEKNDTELQIFSLCNIFGEIIFKELILPEQLPLCLLITKPY